eukprot:5270746-Alexandrium_andersonii.AAC.1
MHMRADLIQCRAMVCDPGRTWLVGSLTWGQPMRNCRLGYSCAAVAGKASAGMHGVSLKIAECPC